MIPHYQTRPRILPDSINSRKSHATENGRFEMAKIIDMLYTGSYRLIIIIYNSSDHDYIILEIIIVDHNNYKQSPSPSTNRSWKNIETHRSYFDSLSNTHFSITHYEQWYDRIPDDLYAYNGRGLLTYYYQSSLKNALETLYPEYPWRRWLFGREWQEIEKQRMYLDSVGENYLSITTHEQWYEKVDRELHAYRGGGLLMRHYGGSLKKALETVYPEYYWKIWEFASVGPNYWKDIENQRLYFDHISKDHLSITHYEQWYDRIGEDLHPYGGQGLLSSHYQDSLKNALEIVYPEYRWNSWQFGYVESENWQLVENQRSYFDQYLLSHQRQHQTDDNNSTLLRHKNTNDNTHDTITNWWEQIPRDIKTSNKYTSLRRLYYSTPDELVTILYPEFPFNESTIIIESDLSKGELDLWQHLHSLNITNDWKANYRHPQLIHYRSGRAMQLDFYSDRLQLAIEYQGMQHYEQGGWRGNDTVSDQRYRDQEKREECARLGIKLIEIDCRVWDQLQIHEKKVFLSHRLTVKQ